MCVCMCLFKGELVENVEPQTLQGIGFSPVYVHMWHFREVMTKKLDPQTSQENCFSPVCVYI